MRVSGLRHPAGLRALSYLGLTVTQACPNNLCSSHVLMILPPLCIILVINFSSFLHHKGEQVCQLPKHNGKACILNFKKSYYNYKTKHFSLHYSRVVHSCIYYWDFRSCRFSHMKLTPKEQCLCLDILG